MCLPSNISAGIFWILLDMKFRMSFMRVALLLFVACFSISCSSSKPGAMVGQKVPSTRVQLLDGPYLPLAEYKGRTVVLVFWAQWCSKSNQLLQALESFAAGKSDSVVFLLVSVDKAEDIQRVRERIEGLGNGKLLSAFSGNAEYDEAYLSFRCKEIPQVFIIDPNGKIIGEGEGMDVIRKVIH